MTSTVARSERLVLRGWDDADVGDLAAIGTPEVVRYLGGKPWTEATGRESINLFRSIGETLVVTTWAVELRSTGELIGTCGYARTNVDWLRRDYVVEIGWTLGRPWWGRGLASEAARAALGLGEERFGLAPILSKCAIDNVASEAVMHRIGMRRVGVVQGRWSNPTVLCRFPR